MTSSNSLGAVVASIEPASEEARDKARNRLNAHGSSESLGALGRIAERIAGARFSPVPPAERRLAVVCGADHAVSNTAQRAASAREVRAIAGGAAPINVLARSADTRVIVVDVGLATGDLGAGVLELRVNGADGDFRRGPAMSRETAIESIETGIALALSLAGEGLDVLGLAQVGAGGDLSAAVLIGALLGQPHDALVVEALSRNGLPIDEPADPIDALAAVGGVDLGALAGLCLSAAALRIPVVLDGGASSASALLATRLAANAQGYLLAAQCGNNYSAQSALAAMELAPMLNLALAPAAALVAAMPLIDGASRLLREIPTRSLPVVG